MNAIATIYDIGTTYDECWETYTNNKYDATYLDRIPLVKMLKVTYEVIGHVEEHGRKMNLVKEIDRKYI